MVQLEVLNELMYILEIHTFLWEIFLKYFIRGAWNSNGVVHYQ